MLLQKEREVARELAQVGYRDKVRPMPGTVKSDRIIQS